MRRCARVTSSLLLLLALSTAAAQNATTATTANTTRCDAYDRDAPTAVTLFRSAQNANSDAVVLYPNCTAWPLSLVVEDGVPALFASALKIQVVESVPLKSGRLYLDSNAITSANLSGYSGLIHVDISSNPSLTTIAAGKIPSSVLYLYLSGSGYTTLKDIIVPDTVEHLFLGENSFEDLNFTLSTSIKELFVDGNTVAISDLENLTFPDSIETLSCTACGIDTIRGVKFPIALKTLNLTDNRIQEFEIRASDQVIFEQVLTDFDAIVQQPSCSTIKPASLRRD
uniref:Leucine-rich repeat-containing N-terminal plant-type domain-containing protein n=1 Tax=Globisporangium ultimum (strain ATCC 200006 / CBS 805.95 / DAOM BR144) TaxID=431595 RepID=K3WBF3_GLOUD